ncbi:MAG: YggU family protein, partial [Gammaproteobacteria bacterium]|nr:YggU family protein [Gammaproteobacteria bacterium]
LLVSVRVQPGASHNEIVGIVSDALKIRITAPPVDGRANSHLIKYLAKTFGVAKSRVNLVSGDNNRNKRLRIHSQIDLPAGISRP